MFQVIPSNKFVRKVDKLIKKNTELKNRIDKAVNFLKQNPKHPGLRTHQINDSDYGKIWSSWVHGDLRIFWKYEGEVIVILLLDIGSHDEVY
jgi:addiction module RelE/StbE family toxin